MSPSQVAPAPVAAPVVAKVEENKEEKKVKRSLKKNVKPQEFGGPGRAKSSFGLFSDSKRPEVIAELRAAAESAGESFKIVNVGKKLGEMWKAVTPEEKAEWEAKGKEAKTAYETTLKAWKETDSYKAFTKEQAAHSKKQKKAKLDAKLKEEGCPKKPLTAYMIFSGKVTSEVISELTAKGEAVTMKSRSNIIKARWEALPADEKKAITDQVEAAKTQYNTDMATFKESETYKKYLKEVAKLNKKPSKKAAGAKKRKGNDGAAVEDEEDDDEDIEASPDEEEEEGDEEGEEDEAEEGEESPEAEA